MFETVGKPHAPGKIHMRKNEFDTEFSQELLPRQMQTPLSGRHTERF